MAGEWGLLALNRRKVHNHTETVCVCGCGTHNPRHHFTQPLTHTRATPQRPHPLVTYDSNTKKRKKEKKTHGRRVLTCGGLHI